MTNASPFALTIARHRRQAAAFHWKMAHEHGAGTKAYAAHLDAHGQWIGAAQRAEAGDTTPCTINDHACPEKA
jgi:hypothetical protein